MNPYKTAVKSEHEDNISKSLKWFLSFISENEWKKRKARIESIISDRILPTKPDSESSTESRRLFIKDDLIGWYLYLAEVMLYEPHKYEYFQGSRVLPIFYRFGVDLELLKKIGGVEKKIKVLVKKRPSEADAFLFEFLTGLLWARNGYEVSFIDEGKGKKVPDLFAKKDNKTWSIECKRQSKTAEYTYRESEKRRKMISYIAKDINNHNILLDILFHVELEALPDNFLRNLLKDKLAHAKPGKIISNEKVDIDLSFVDVQVINQHLKNYDIKLNSPFLNNLIGRKSIDGRAFTRSVSIVKFFRKGEGGDNLFVDEISNASGVYSSCDAEASMWMKARDVKSQVFAAMQQFNSSDTAVIHIGMETFEGPQVEKIRFEKIRETFQKLNPTDKNLQWVYLHYFQAYSPPDQDWVFDETVSSIVASAISSNLSPKPPLDIRLMIVSENGDNQTDIYHWERPLP